MKAFVVNNVQFLVLLIIWLFVGMSIPQASIVIIPLSLILLFIKGFHKELLLGFFFILTLSDSRLDSLAFTSTIKNIYIVFLSLFFMFENKKVNFKIPFFLYIIPFLAIAFYCTINSPTFGVSFQKTLSYGLMFLVIPNYFSLIMNKYGNEFLKDIVWFITIVLCYGIFLQLINSDVASLLGRYRGVLGNPNGLGIYTILFTIMFHVINILYKGLFTKREALFLYALCFLNLYLCGSRSSLIATLLFFFLSKFYKIDNFLGFIIFIVVLFLYQIVSDNINTIVIALGLESFFRLNSLESGSGRIVAWAFAWKHIQKNLYFGLGFNYSEYLYRINYAYLAKLNHQGAVHNAYLTFWLDTGFFGLTTFLSGFVLMFHKIKRITPLVFPILYAVLFSNQFESWLTASLNPFTIQLLIILSIIYYKGFHDEDEKNNSDEIIKESNENRISVY